MKGDFAIRGDIGGHSDLCVKRRNRGIFGQMDRGYFWNSKNTFRKYSNF
jgi:hypothetical protein